MTQLYLTMPQPGETITEGTIVEWTAKEGDAIEESGVVAELETEKAVFEYESPFEGRLVKILHAEGSRVNVAEPIAIMEVAEDKAQTYIMMGIAKEVGASQAPAAKTPSVKVESAPRPSSNVEIQASGEQALAAVQMGSVGTAVSEIIPTEIRMAPYVRKMVRELGVTALQMQTMAAANQGRITKDVIDAFRRGAATGQMNTAAPAVSAPVVKSPVSKAAGEYTSEKCSAIRMRIADNMVLSKTKIPHAHNGIAVDVTRVVEYREENKVSFKEKTGTTLNFLSLIYPALVKAIQAYPMINACYDDTTSPHQIHFYKNINLGVAAGTEHGLVIPVVHGMNTLSFSDFNTELNNKLKKATTKKLKPDDLMGATLIFNNYGFFGTNLGVQVIQYPMAATLGMSAIEQRVVPVDGKPGVRTMADFVLSFDHRVMDGRETGMFLKTLKEAVEGLNFDHVG